ncbi:MAG TPA: hypothetical protein VGK19_11785 [Capsulimonadaceae bacterium]
MKYKHIIALGAILGTVLWIVGCGGGGSNSGSPLSPSNKAGQATVSVTWPTAAQAKLKPRLIPLASGVIVVTASLTNVGAPPPRIAASSVLVLTPPTGSTSVTTGSITGLPVGQSVYFTARAYPAGTVVDAAGNAGGAIEQAKGTSLPVPITTGTNVFSVSLASDVTKIATSVTFSPGHSGSDITIGDYVDLSATPQDAAGNTVLVDDSKMVWSSSDSFSLGTFGGGSASNGITTFTGPKVRARIVAPASGLNGIVKIVDTESPTAVGAVSGTSPAGASFIVVKPNTTGVVQKAVGGSTTGITDPCGGNSVEALVRPRSGANPRAVAISNFLPPVTIGKDLKNASKQTVYIAVPSFLGANPGAPPPADTLVKAFTVGVVAEDASQRFIIPKPATGGSFQYITRNSTGLVLANATTVTEFGAPTASPTPKTLYSSPITFTNIQSLASATLMTGETYTYVLDKLAGGTFRVSKLDDASLNIVSSFAVSATILPATANGATIAADDEGSVYVGGTKIAKYDAAGTAVSAFNVTGLGIPLPAYAAVSVANGVVYAMDSSPTLPRIVELGLTGKPIDILILQPATTFSTFSGAVYGQNIAVGPAADGTINIATEVVSSSSDTSIDPGCGATVITDTLETAVAINPQT